VENLGHVISQHPFCKGLKPNYIDLLAGCASNVRFEQGQHLFREGGEANQFYLIREGKVLLEIPTPQCPSLHLETVESGEVLGWSWLVPPYRWRFGARAVKPVGAIAVNGKCLRVKCEKDSDLGYELLKRTVEIMGQRLDATRFRLVDLYSAETVGEPGLALKSYPFR
jgi:CRP/FNR family transcriptional regulator, cyclic AMP receptor protein